MDYADGFATLLRCFEGRAHERAFLEALAAGQPRTGRAADWGAGSGDLTRLLLAHFDEVHAIEPDPAMRLALAQACPSAIVHAGTLQDTVLPAPVAFAVASHVLYHLPEAGWGRAVRHMAAQLAPGGVLAISLKAPHSGCNAMLRHFGAAPFDLRATLAPALAGAPGLSVAFHEVPGHVATTSYEDTLRIARFLLADRPAHGYPAPPAQEDVGAYVRTHLWDAASGRGGWRCPTVFCVVRYAADAIRGESPC